MTKILFFDLETTGLPETRGFNKYYPYDEIIRYRNSRIVQVAVILVEYQNNEQKIIEEQNFIIRPDGFQITNDKIHGISHQMAVFAGISFIAVADQLKSIITQADILIAHNILFDKNVLCAELFRYGRQEDIDIIQRKGEFCTSKNCDVITKIRCSRYYKQPTLAELYQFLFKKEANNLHNAIQDTRILMQCFNKLLDAGHFCIILNQIHRRE